MKIVPVCLAALCFAAAPSDVKVRALQDPVFGRSLLVVVEYTGDDAGAMWEIDDEQLEEVRSDAGEVLKLSPFGVQLVNPGDRDPTRDGYRKLEAGRSLIVFQFNEPQQPVQAIPRMAGTLALLHGGEQRWVDVPFSKTAKAKPWKDADLAAAGFELTHGVREVQQMHLRLAGETFDVARVQLLVEGRAEPLETISSNGDLAAIVYEFDLGDADASQVRARVELDDGTVVEVGKLGVKPKFAPIKSAELADVKLELQVRQVAVREAFAEGTGTYDLLRGYRWVDKAGRAVDLFPQSQSSGSGKSVATSCRVPADLAKGLRLQLGVLVGAQLETVPFAYENIAGPAK